MIKKTLVAITLALMTSASALAQVIYIQTGPPTAVYETVPASPGYGYVWVGGYYRWDGYRYTWVRGRYERHEGRWCGGHWHHADRGWYWSEGRWC